MATPAALLAAVVIVAVWLVLGFSADEVGVNVASVFAAFMTTVPATSSPVVSFTLNVSEFTVAGSMGWLKVAVIPVPVTTLSLVLMLVGTSVAQLLGLDEITVGSAAAPATVPGATLTPGATAAKTLFIPPLASKQAARNNTHTASL
jgi:hypothetical protein